MFGELLKKKRKAKGLTQGELAALSNITVQTISRIEKGKIPSPLIAYRLSKAFGDEELFKYFENIKNKNNTINAH